MWEAVALQKLLTFLQQKYQCIFENTSATTVKEFVINKQKKKKD